LRGSLDIETIHRGEYGSLEFKLDSPNRGLMLTANNYIVMRNFTEDAILMVVCDTEFRDEISYGEP